MLPIDMFDRLLALFDTSSTGSQAKPEADPLQLAAAALLLVAARLDGEIMEVERSSILKALRRLPNVTDAEALVREAEDSAAASTDFYQFTSVIRKNVPYEQRGTIIEMLWEVVLADGVVDDFEANLIRRVAGLLHVPDLDVGEARKRAAARSSTETPG